MTPDGLAALDAQLAHLKALYWRPAPRKQDGSLDRAADVLWKHEIAGKIRLMKLRRDCAARAAAASAPTD